MVWVYAGAGLVLLLLIVGYGVGYQLGTSATRDAERRAASRDAERVFVDDPLRAEEPSEPSVEGSTEADPPEPSPRPRIAGGVLLSNGRTGPDPRREGLNYLELATLKREQAAEAVRYLATNGEEAIAVPLDRRGSGSNTSDSFRIVAMGLAVPGERYRSSADARKRFEERLARLGRAWADAGGASDFSDPLWRKFGG